MLRITDPALSFLDEARKAQRLPEHYGVRVFGAARLDGQGAFQISFSEEPFSGDEVTETGGPRVFVAPEISGSSEELVLDLDERDQLVLRPA